VKKCPACHAELPDKAIACPQCRGSYLPDGSFRTALEASMDRLATERERKVERAEAFGRLGRPHTTFFLESKSGGCLPTALALIVIVLAPAFS
jgi:Zn-finger nucleic acid-binding protein